MGARKKIRTKWKAERKIQIRKISAKRLKKALKQTTPAGTKAKKQEEKQAA